MYYSSGNTVSHAVVIWGMICKDVFSVKGTVAGNKVSGGCVKANMAPAAGNVYGRYRNCVMDDTTVIH